MLLDGECQQIEEQVFGSKQTSFGEQTNSPLSTSLFFPLMSPSLAPSLAYLEQRSVSLEPCRAQRGYGTKTAPEVDA